MFLVGSKTVRISEYSSTDVEKKTKKGKGRRTLPALTPTSHPALLVSPGRLAAALGKTILTINPRSLDLAFQAVVSFLGMQAWISGKDSDLRLNSGFRGSYRDFSKTARTGELAQAITFILAQDHLGFPFVSDYGGYLRSLGLVPDDTKSAPDFVLWTTRAHKVSLIESKGSLPSKKSTAVRTQLRDALDQARHGKDEFRRLGGPAVQQRFASLVRFSERGDPWGTQLHYCDPQETHGSSHESHVPYRHYYASWFAFLGYHVTAAHLMEGGPLDLTKQTRRVTAEGVEYLVLSESRLPVPTEVAHFSYPNADIRHSPGRWSFALSEAVCSRLRSEHNDPADEWPIGPSYSDDSVDLISDGTAVFFERGANGS